MHVFCAVMQFLMISQLVVARQCSLFKLLELNNHITNTPMLLRYAMHVLKSLSLSLCLFTSLFFFLADTTFI